MSDRTNKVVKGFTTSLAQYFVVTLLQILLVPIVLRIAGQEVLGAYAIIMQVIGYGLILDMGIGVAVSRYLSQASPLEDGGDKFSSVFNVGRYFLLITNIVTAMFILLMAFNVAILFEADSIIQDDAKVGMVLLALWTVIRTPVQPYSQALMATQNMAAVNVVGIAGSFVRLGLSLYFVMSGFELLGLIIAKIISDITSYVACRIYFRKLYERVSIRWQGLDLRLAKEIFSFGLTYWGVNLAMVLTLGSDSLVVGYLFGAASVSLFYATKIPSLLGIQLIYKISDNAAPAANELYGSNSLVTLREAFISITKYSLYLALPLSIGIVCFNEGVIAAWVGSEQYAGDVMSAALACYVLTQVVGHINAMVVVASGNLKYWTSVCILSGIASLIFSLILGRYLGFQWVMVALVVMDIPSLIFLFRRCFRILEINASDYISEAFLPALWSSIPLVILAFIIDRFLLTGNLMHLLFWISVYSATWLAGIYTIALNASEKNYLLLALSRILPRHY